MITAKVKRDGAASGRHRNAFSALGNEQKMADRLHAARRRMHHAENNARLHGNVGGADALAIRIEYAAATRELREANAPVDALRQQRIDDVVDYKTLLSVALWEIATFNLEAFASFPIFTGSEADGPAVNVARGARFVNMLTAHGYAVWSQVPYLDMIVQPLVPFVPDSVKIFDDFYQPLLEGRNLRTIAMMEGWQASDGCKTELRYAQVAKMDVVYPKDEHFAK
jgi:hypothetical protein